MSAREANTGTKGKPFTVIVLCEEEELTKIRNRYILTQCRDMTPQGHLGNCLPLCPRHLERGWTRDRTLNILPKLTYEAP